MANSEHAETVGIDELLADLLHEARAALIDALRELGAGNYVAADAKAAKAANLIEHYANAREARTRRGR